MLAYARLSVGSTLLVFPPITPVSFDLLLVPPPDVDAFLLTSSLCSLLLEELPDVVNWVVLNWWSLKYNGTKL